MLLLLLAICLVCARDYDLTDELFSDHDLRTEKLIETDLTGEFLEAGTMDRIAIDLAELCEQQLLCDHAFVKSWTFFVQFKPLGLSSFIPYDFRVFFESPLASNPKVPKVSSPLTDWTFQIKPWEMNTRVHYFYIVSPPNSVSDRYHVQFRLEKAHALELGYATENDITAAHQQIKRYFTVNVPWPLPDKFNSLQLSVDVSRPSDWHAECVTDSTSGSLKNNICLSKYWGGKNMADRYASSPFVICLASDLAKEHIIAGCEHLALIYAQRVTRRGETPQTVQQAVCHEAGLEAKCSAACITGVTLVQLESVWSVLPNSERYPSKFAHTRVLMRELCENLEGMSLLGCYNALGRFEYDNENLERSLYFCELVAEEESDETLREQKISACIDGVFDAPLEKKMYSSTASLDVLSDECDSVDALQGSLSTDFSKIEYAQRSCYTTIGRISALWTGYNVIEAEEQVCDQLKNGKADCISGVKSTVTNRDPDAFLDGVCTQSIFKLSVSATIPDLGQTVHVTDVFKPIEISWRDVEELPDGMTKLSSSLSRQDFEAAAQLMAAENQTFIPVYIEYSSPGAEFVAKVELAGLEDEYIPASTTAVMSNTQKDNQNSSAVVHVESEHPDTGVIPVVLLVIGLLICVVVGAVLFIRKKKLKPTYA